jgi:hypothetical protein
MMIVKRDVGLGLLLVSLGLALPGKLAELVVVKSEARLDRRLRQIMAATLRR